MNSATELTGLLPLIPAPAPPPAWWLELLPLAVLAAFIGLMAWWWWRPSRQLNRRLRALTRQLDTPGVDTRRIAFELDHWLRARFKRSQLTAQQPPSTPLAQSWQTLLLQLQQARFDAQAPSRAQLRALFAETRQLLRDLHD